jgi:hypothetical protein|tara:strand:+ start:3116 stop:3292 length:177 start_codon:yes stop_codon:yes gene_type:complete
LITDLLDIAREELDMLTITSEPFEVRGTLEQVLVLNQGDYDCVAKCLGDLIEAPFKYS